MAGGSEWTPAGAEVVACECDSMRCMESCAVVSPGCKESDLPANIREQKESLLTQMAPIFVIAASVFKGCSLVNKPPAAIHNL